MTFSSAAGASAAEIPIDDMPAAAMHAHRNILMLLFIVCNQFFGWYEPADRLELSEETEGDDTHYGVAWDGNDHCKRASEVSGYKQDYEYFQRDVLNDIYESIGLAKAAGVKPCNIILDPGIGFAKNHDQNIEIMRRLDTLCLLGYPVLLGTSRKSLIGNVLGLPAHERLEGTAATVCFGIQKGCHLVRVHDVKEMARLAKMMDALVGKGEENG